MDCLGSLDLKRLEWTVVVLVTTVGGEYWNRLELKRPDWTELNKNRVK
jgi:hypothetical protein